MYSLADYGAMIADSVRTGSYIRAIKAAVCPGSVVVDVGSGSSFFSLVACRAGARRVYAIDQADIIQLGRQLATANGFGDRIEFFQEDSRQIQLPERADVIVSDLRGALPFHGNAIVTLEDARRRFLGEKGILIPHRDTLYAAIVELQKFYDEINSVWQRRVEHLDLSPALTSIFNDLYVTRVTSDQLITEPQAWCVLEYTKSPSPRASATLCFRPARNATAHGIALWFDSQLFEDIGFSCAPSGPRTVYGQGFLPWPQPVSLSAGREIQVELHADPVGGDYVWRWETRLFDEGKGEVQHFQQSTLQGARFSPNWLHRHAADFVPVLSEAGEAERWLLQAMDGSRTLEAIAREAVERFPNVFSRPEDAFRRAARLAGKFSR